MPFPVRSFVCCQSFCVAVYVDRLRSLPRRVVRSLRAVTDVTLCRTALPFTTRLRSRCRVYRLFCVDFVRLTRIVAVTRCAACVLPHVYRSSRSAARSRVTAVSFVPDRFTDCLFCVRSRLPHYVTSFHTHYRCSWVIVTLPVTLRYAHCLRCSAGTVVDRVDAVMPIICSRCIVCTLRLSLFRNFTLLRCTFVACHIVSCCTLRFCTVLPVTTCHTMPRTVPF